MLRLPSSWNMLVTRLGLKHSSTKRKAISTKRRLHLETLEDRRVLAPFTVSNLDDSGAGSLRAAVFEANQLPSFDTINFAIDEEELPTDGSIPTINLQSPLPTVTDPACRYRPLFRTALCDNAGLAA